MKTLERKVDRVLALTNKLLSATQKMEKKYIELNNLKFEVK